MDPNSQIVAQRMTVGALQTMSLASPSAVGLVFCLSLISSPDLLLLHYSPILRYALIVSTNCTTPTPQTVDPRLSATYKPPLILHDLTTSNVVQPALVPPASKAVNRAILSVHESMRQRVKLRVGVEAWTSWSGQRAYKRLRGQHVLVSCPNAEQAELFIQAVHEFAMSLNGKWLASKPEQEHVKT
jgi:hypothetical protein